MEPHPLLHLHSQADSESTFFPVNTTVGRTGSAVPPFVRIDVADLPLVVGHNWTTTPTGQVICRKYDPIASAAERKVVHLRLVLTDLLRPSDDGRLGVVYRNGDSLDCRRGNLELKTDAREWPRYTPGISFISLPTFAIAREKYPVFQSEYGNFFRRGRKPTVLSHEEVRQFLADMLDETLPYGKMATRELVKAYFHDGLERPNVNGQLVSDILAGRNMPQPGIDYTHPTLRWRTREATKARRKKLHADAEKLG